MIMKRERKLEVAALLLVFAIGLAAGYVQYVWLKMDQRPPEGDGIPFILNGMKFYDLFYKVDFPAFFKEVLRFRMESPYPPLGGIIYCIYYMIFGLASEMELMVNMFFNMIAIMAIYGIGKSLVNKRTGLFAVFLFVCMPGMLNYSKLGMREVLLAYLLPVFFYYSIKCEYFKRTRYSVLLGLSVGLLVWIKSQIILCIAPPAFMMLVDLYQRRNTLAREDHSLIFKNMTLAILCAAASGSLWYVLNFREILTIVSLRLTNHSAAASPIGINLHGWYYYFEAYGRKLLTSVQAYILIGLLIAFLEIRDSFILRFCFYALFPALILGFIMPQEPAHVLPAMSLWAIIIAALTFTIKSRIVRYFVIFMLVTNGINTNYIQFLLCKAPVQKMAALPLKVNGVDHLSYKKALRSVGMNDFGVLLSVEKIPLADIIRESLSLPISMESPDSHQRLLVLINYFPFRYFSFEYYLRKAKIDVTVVHPSYPPSINYDSFLDEMFSPGPGYNYIIKTNTYMNQYDPGEDEELIRAYQFLEDNKELFAEQYEYVKTISFPTWPLKECQIYKRKI
jgi:hypothetical protein